MSHTNSRYKTEEIAPLACFVIRLSIGLLMEEMYNDNNTREQNKKKEMLSGIFHLIPLY